MNVLQQGDMVMGALLAVGSSARIGDADLQRMKRLVSSPELLQRPPICTPQTHALRALCEAAASSPTYRALSVSSALAWPSRGWIVLVVVATFPIQSPPTSPPPSFCSQTSPYARSSATAPTVASPQDMPMPGSYSARLSADSAAAP